MHQKLFQSYQHKLLNDKTVFSYKIYFQKNYIVLVSIFFFSIAIKKDTKNQNSSINSLALKGFHFTSEFIFIYHVSRTLKQKEFWRRNVKLFALQESDHCTLMCVGISIYVYIYKRIRDLILSRSFLRCFFPLFVFFC